MRKPLPFLTAVLLLAAAALHAQGIDFHQGDWASALRRARAENRLIFLDAYTTWCGPCKMMDRKTFSDPAVGAYYNDRFINVKMDMEKGEGIGLNHRYNILAYPTLLFLDADGEVVHRVAGYHGPEKFLLLGEDAQDPNRKLRAFDERYAAGERSADFLHEYALKLADAKDIRQNAVGIEYINTQSDWSTPRNIRFVYDFMEFIDDPFFAYVVKERSRFEAEFGEEDVAQKIEWIFEFSDFSKEPDWQAIRALVDKVYPTDAERRFEGLKVHHYRKKGDMKTYTELAIPYYNRYFGEDADALNDAAWVFYEYVDDPKALQVALGWVKKSVKLEETYGNTDTLAALYYKLGDKKKARKAALRALALGEEEGTDTESTRQLLEQIDQMK